MFLEIKYMFLEIIYLLNRKETPLKNVHREKKKGKILTEFSNEKKIYIFYCYRFNNRRK